MFEGVDENGELTLKMCVQNEVAICNHFIRKKNVHKRECVQSVS